MLFSKILFCQKAENQNISFLFYMGKNPAHDLLGEMVEWTRVLFACVLNRYMHVPRVFVCVSIHL